MNLNDYTITVPHHWSSEEALTFVAFLDQVAQAIWSLHGDGMMAVLNRSQRACLCSPASSQHFDTVCDPADDLPF